ncbi:hypothetical protein H8959_006741, partial [Pygathrix nigripes]
PPAQRRMAAGNHSTVTEFILRGLTKRADLQLPLFLLFLGIYLVTMVGNLGMITLIRLNSQLHTPMYYFLSNLSLVDLCYSSVITPKMLVNFVSEKNIISYAGCMSQLYFFLVFVIAECYMLTVMAYDRYVAICHPLLYNIIMPHHTCSLLVAVVYAMGLIGSTIETGLMLKLPYCERLISHYFCDILPLMKLSCSSTYDVEMAVFFLAGFDIIVTSLTVLVSYTFILSSILSISSTEGRSKAFSTCSSHLAAVGMFYGSTAFMYLKPSTISSLAQENVVLCVLHHGNPHVESPNLQHEKQGSKGCHAENTEELYALRSPAANKTGKFIAVGLPLLLMSLAQEFSSLGLESELCFARTLYSSSLKEKKEEEEEEEDAEKEGTTT